jgi:hypothetical protein
MKGNERPLGFFVGTMLEVRGGGDSSEGYIRNLTFR